MDRRPHNRRMAAFLVLGFLVLIGPVAVFFGADSRRDEPQRPW